MKSCPSALIVGWRNDDVVHLPRLVPLKLVAPSLQPREVGMFPSMGSMAPQPFTAGGNRPYLEVLGRNWRPAVPWVNYSNSSPRGLRRVGGRSRSLDGGQNRYSYDTVGTSVGFGGKIVGLKPPGS
jgi:hypothetical protein